MAIKPTPPSPPKSNLPGKNIPVSEKKLGSLDKESPKSLDEKEVKKTGDSGETTGEEKKAKEEGEGEEEKKEDESEETEEEEKIETAHFGLLNLLEPMGIMTFVTAVIFDLTGTFLMILDLAFGIGEVFSWFADDFCGGMTMYVLLKDISPKKAGHAKRIGEEAKEKIKKKVVQAGQKTTQQGAKAAVKAGSAVTRRVAPFLGRFAACGLGKVIPVIGGIIPFWTILVIWTYWKS
jgi:hypothetical protein